MKETDRADILVKYAFELTDYLHLATRLLSVDEGGIRLPQFYRPAIEEHEQNGNRGTRGHWTVLIDWVRDSYFALAHQNNGREETLLRRWIEYREGLFNRLVLHVITEDEASDTELAQDIVLRGDPIGLWDMELHHELLLFLKKSAHRLDRSFQRDLTSAIERGPILEERRGQEAEQIEQRRKWEISVRLRQLANAGVPLSESSQSIAEWSRPSEIENPERETFLSWSGGARWLARKDQMRPGWEKPTLDQLVSALQEKELDAEEFEAIAIVRPCTAFLALRALGTSQAWPAIYWERLIWAAMARIRERKLRPQRERTLAELLSSAPEALFSQINISIAEFLESYAKTCPISDESGFNSLWTHAWLGISDSSNAPDDEVLSEALNSGAGRLGEAALHRLWKYKPSPDGGIPEVISPYLNSVASHPAGRLGRAFLMTQLSNLFAIDPHWTREHLIPRLNWASSTEARDLWSAYAWSASSGPNLLDAFKPYFLEALFRYTELAGQRTNLVHLFVTICLEEPSAFTRSQIRDVLAALPEAGIVDIANFMEELLNGDPEDRAKLWRDIVGPWLGRFWPSDTKRNTTATSLGLISCLVKTGPAFPEAVEWALEHLRSGTDHTLWRLEENEVHLQFPEASLDLLMAIVPDNESDPISLDTELA